MDCSCRTAALRIFVKSIAQIHVPLRAATPRVTQYQTLYNQAVRSHSQRAGPVATIASRAVHTSCVRHGAAAHAQAVRDQTEGENHHEDSRTKGTRRTIPEPAADRNGEVGSQDARADNTNRGGHEHPTVDPVPEPKKKAKKSKKDKDQTRRGRANEDDDSRLAPKEPWRAQKDALKKKFPGGWNPRKKLSPDALVGIRMLHQQFPDEYTTEVLAQKFEVSPEAIRRILKSKWAPDADEEEERQARWFNRGKQVWTHWAALGKKPPRKWRAEGIVRDPYWNKPRGPNHKDKDARAEAQRRRARGLTW